MDDPHFSLAYHLRHTAIPSPGGDAQLRALVARVLSQRLDVDRPLWEMWLVEGLPEERWAMITKTHHAMIDGLAGNELMEIVLDRDRDAPRRPPTALAARAPSPRGVELAASGVAGIARLPVDVTRAAAAAVRGFSSPGDARTGRGRPRLRAGDRGAQRREPDERPQRPVGSAPALGLGAR